MREHYKIVKMSEVIDRFSGPYSFLSNFFRAPIVFEGEQYPTLEHAYQAAKTEIEIDRVEIALAPTPGAAKRMGRELLLRPNWDRYWKARIMRELVRQKFSEYFLARKLEETFPAKLIEGNYWGDTYWGVCNGVGKNKLGKILMQVREEVMARR